MKRGWAILLAGVLILAIALPVGAEKPNCWELPEDHPLYCEPPEPPPPPSTTTTIPEVAVCSFDDGVLDSWHGQAGDERQCIWEVANPGDTFRFEIQSPDGSVEEVKLPVLIVNDDIVFPSDKCFHDASGRGFQDLPYPADDSWEITPASAGCGDGPYLLTISIQALKSDLENVDLVMTQTPSTN